MQVAKFFGDLKTVNSRCLQNKALVRVGWASLMPTSTGQIKSGISTGDSEKIEALIHLEISRVWPFRPNIYTGGQNVHRGSKYTQGPSPKIYTGGPSYEPLVCLIGHWRIKAARPVPKLQTEKMLPMNMLPMNMLPLIRHLHCLLQFLPHQPALHTHLHLPFFVTALPFCLYLLILPHHN